MIPFSEITSFVTTMIFNLLLVGTVISVGVYITLKLIRNAAPRLRYVLAVTSFAAAVVLPFLIAFTPTRSGRDAHVSEPTGFENAGILAGPITTNHQVNVDSASSPPDVSQTLGKMVSQSRGRVVNALANPATSRVLFSVWLIAALLLLGREMVGHLFAVRARLRWKPASRLLRTRLSWPENLRLSVDNEFGPCALGIIRPTVVMPSLLIDELSADAAQQVARHELNHLRWRDPLVNTIMRITRACLWPSVPLWYLHRVASLEREAAADRAAIESLSGRPPDVAALEYASTLLSIARRRARSSAERRYYFAVTELGRRAGLHERVRRLMASSARPRHANLLLASVTLLTSIGALTVLPVLKVQSQNNSRASNHAAVTKLPNDFGSAAAGIQANPGDAIARVSPTLPEHDTYPRQDTPALVIDDGIINPTVASSLAQETSGPSVTIKLFGDDFQNQMSAVGYKDLSPKQLADMKAAAVGPWYVAELAEAGYRDLPADMLIRFKWLAVSGAYIREMKELGYDNLNTGTLAEFRRLGVSSTFIREMRALVSGPISAEQLVSMRFYGASKEFVSQLNGLGYQSVSAEQLISMRMHGVSVPYIEAVKSRGLRNLSLDDLIGMRMRNNY